MSYVGRRSADSPDYNPIDTVEDYVDKQGWAFERIDYQEAYIEITGKWADYRVGVFWRPELSYLCLTCRFDLKIPLPRKSDVIQLIARINEKIWLGHFDFSSELSGPIFRCSLPLRGIKSLAFEQIEDFFKTAIDESERFYPVFQFVVWANHAPEKAMEMAILETVGEA